MPDKMFFWLVVRRRPPVEARPSPGRRRPPPGRRRPPPRRPEPRCRTPSNAGLGMAKPRPRLFFFLCFLMAFVAAYTAAAIAAVPRALLTEPLLRNRLELKAPGNALNCPPGKGAPTKRLRCFVMRRGRFRFTIAALLLLLWLVVLRCANKIYSHNASEVMEST